ncbi:unnamed protein product [Caenorhabditis auriculariae]|uniref:Protein kinase domain-containing protein n=1 Tax=Caenorhabditis auriculariae TaxID=2777116 RepID=A0A8S1GR13_9PELO|nr:unnamed protein product [Caenorhabditis auriculariae]
MVVKEPPNNAAAPTGSKRTNTVAQSSKRGKKKVERKSFFEKSKTNTQSPGPRTGGTTERKTTDQGSLNPTSEAKTNVLKEKCKPKLVEGDLIDGINTYKVTGLLRSGRVVEYYKAKDNDLEGVEYLLRTQNSEKGRLKIEANLIMKASKLPGEKKFCDYVEFGNSARHKVDFLITGMVGPTLEEVRTQYLKADFSLDCGFNVASQMLKGIQDVHKIGYVHRHIKPANFVIGVGDAIQNVYIFDFRISRQHIDPSTKKPKLARERVPFCGTARYASRANMRNLEQGRKDDLESWIYTIFYLMDQQSISWRRLDKERILGEKEKLFKHELNDTYKVIPKQMKLLIDYIRDQKYDVEPDYSYLETFLKNTAKEYNLNTKKCDWKDVAPHDAQRCPTVELSVDNRLSGKMDEQPGERGKKKKKTADRKKMDPGDVIKSEGSSWKVVSLLGSGGFGDVYKVHKDGGPAAKMYALKTEGCEGEKRMLRLKVEVMVMMKCWADKTKKFEHFVEFVDRGKCEALQCKFVVMGLVGPSIDDVRRKYILSQFSRNTTFNVAIQTVQAVEDLHSIGYLHRDIKPANYAVGLGEAESIVYMLDFGIAKTFLDQGGQHKTPRKKVRFLGTLRYASRACHKQLEQGRKDDLECWLYMLFEIMDDNYGMPWFKTVGAKNVLAKKEAFFEGELPQMYTRMPKSMSILVKYIDGLEYASEPDYTYIKEFLRSCAKDNGIKIDKKLDWLGKLKKRADLDSGTSDSDEDKASRSGSE